MVSKTEFASRLSYPNPFRPSGIEFDMPGDGVVTLKIYDSEGAEVDTLIEKKEYKTGRYSIEFLSDDYSTGVYFYRLSVQVAEKSYIDTKTIVVGK